MMGWRSLAVGFLTLDILFAAPCQSMAVLRRADGLPTCAASCLVGALPSSTCSLADVSCICSDAQLNAEVAACVLDECTTLEAMAAKNFSDAQCGVQEPPAPRAVFYLAALLGLAALAVVLRLLARYCASVYFGWDDLCTFLAFACCTVYVVGGFVVAQHGFGGDIWHIPPAGIILNMQIYWLDSILYCVARGLIRASIIFRYLRIFPDTSNAVMYRLVLWSGVVNFVHIAAFTLATIFYCWPVYYFWFKWNAQSVVHGRCVDMFALALSSSIVGIVFDLWLILLPWPGLWRLNLSRRKKILAGCMLSFGLVSFFVSLVRLRTLRIFSTTTNPSRDFVDIGFLSGMEIILGTMCPCLPSIRLLAVRHGPHWMRRQSVASGEPGSPDSPQASSEPKGHSICAARNQPPTATGDESKICLGTTKETLVVGSCKVEAPEWGYASGPHTPPQECSWGDSDGVPLRGTSEGWVRPLT